MRDESTTLAMEGVRFFGQMSASLSHEIKNVLAIINENAGLLQDLVAMHVRGAELPTERLVSLAEAIGRQVTRGDQTIRRLNTFAHSADQPVERVDLPALIGFMIQLTGRLIAMQGQPPQFEPPPAPVTATTNRFFLENLIWVCLERAMQACPPEQSVMIAMEKTEDCVRIRFRGLGVSQLAHGPPFPSDREAVVGRSIQARITAYPDAGEIVLTLDQPPQPSSLSPTDRERARAITKGEPNDGKSTAG